MGMENIDRFATDDSLRDAKASKRMENLKRWRKRKERRLAKIREKIEIRQIKEKRKFERFEQIDGQKKLKRRFGNGKTRPKRSITKEVVRQIEMQNEDNEKICQKKIAFYREYVTPYMWCDLETFDVITNTCGKITCVTILEVIDAMYDDNYDHDSSLVEGLNETAYEIALQNKKTFENLRHAATVAGIEHRYCIKLKRDHVTSENKNKSQKELKKKLKKSLTATKKKHERIMYFIGKWSDEMKDILGIDSDM
jgi:hypothetical protein